MKKFEKQQYIRRITIPETKTILEAVRILNETASQILFIVDEQGRLKGTLTDGDIRRGIISGKELSASIRDVYNSTPKSLSSHSFREAKMLMETYGISRIPVLNNKNQPVSLICFEDILAGEQAVEQRTNKVVVMAGGRGSRLEPITRIVPKPLLPVGEKPMLELIMESFATCGFRDFLLSLNYRKDFIKTYLAERNDLPFTIFYVEEETFLGTAGSLALMRDHLEETFFVSNCDILVDVNYTSALEFHQENHYAFTIVGALKTVNVPYGVIHLNNGEFDRIEEKPDMPLIVNTGVYLLEPESIALIKDGERIDMPDLIERIRTDGGKVGVFPVHRKWIDIGQWGEYKRALE